MPLDYNVVMPTLSIGRPVLRRSNFSHFVKVMYNMLNRFMILVPSFRLDKRAVTAIEYALIAALIAVVIIAALKILGTSISGTFNKVSSEL